MTAGFSPGRDHVEQTSLLGACPHLKSVEAGVVDELVILELSLKFVSCFYHNYDFPNLKPSSFVS